MLGKVKKRQAPRRVRGEMLEELKKLERYKKQYHFPVSYTHLDVYKRQEQLGIFF